MSYLSATENVGFTTQTISDSCATQYKMATEGVQMDVDVNSYMNDNSINESSYLSHYNNDNYYHSKFKIDPNELYTFHDSDVISNEVTVENDDYIVTETDDFQEKPLEIDTEDVRPKEIDNPYPLINGIVKQQTQVGIVKQQTQVKNGHLKPAPIKKARVKKVSKPVPVKVDKILNHKSQASIKKESSKKVIHELLQNYKKLKAEKPVIIKSDILSASPKLSISNVNQNVSSSSSPASKPSETFLDVFKRELSVKGILPDEPKIRTEQDLPVPPLVQIKTPAAAGSKKPSTANKQQASTSKHRRGRGPTIHEALQRIPKRAIPVPNRSWHAPEHELFECGPLTDMKTNPFKLADTSSDDDEHLPDLGVEIGCVEELTAEHRGTRLALRRAALRRQLAKASTTLELVRDNRREKALATVVSNQLKRRSSSHISPQLVNHLLVDRGMTSLFTSRERRKLRLSGWSGGESLHQSLCNDPSCSALALPCTTQCLHHVIKDPTQRLFRACGAVFSDGGRCTELISPLDEQPLCQQHQWKKDNYDKQSRETKQRKPARPRNSPSSNRRVRRRPRSRPAPKLPGHLSHSPGHLSNSPGHISKSPGHLLSNTPGHLPRNLPHLPSHLLPNLPGNLAGNLPGLPATHLSASRLGGPQRANHRLTAQSLSTHNIITSHSMSDVNTSVCSNSSAYESGDEATLGGGGALSETEFIVSADEVNELVVGEVGHVHGDDILDPAVLSQIPDEAFTEFFNQAEGGATFAESSELTRALEAVLDERALDTLADCVVSNARSKLHVPASIGVEMSSSTPS